MEGFDLVTIVRFIDGFQRIYAKPSPALGSSAFFFDVQARTTSPLFFRLRSSPYLVIPKVQKSRSPARTVRLEKAAAQTSNYQRTVWTIYCEAQSLLLDGNDVFGQDPPKAFGEGGNGSVILASTLRCHWPIPFTRA